MSGTGRNIRLLRESRDMTQADIAKIAGVTDKAVSTWEKGIKEPRMGALTRIAEYFRVTPSMIIDDEDIMVQKRKPATAEGDGLAEKNRRLIEWFRSLPPEKQRAILIAQDAPEGLV